MGRGSRKKGMGKGEWEEVVGRREWEEGSREKWDAGGFIFYFYKSNFFLFYPITFSLILSEQPEVMT